VGIDRRSVAMAALLWAASTSAALADPAAEQLFRDGKQLLKDGRVDQACEKLAASQAIEAKSGTLLNLADCRERQGRFASAWELFLQARALANRENQGVRAGEAGKRAEAIAPRRAFLRIELAADAAVAGLVITRDGVAVPTTVWNTAVPIDPGRYDLVAKAPRYLAQTTTVEVVGEANVTATIAALLVDPDPPRDESPPGARDAPTTIAARRARTLGIGPLIGLTSDGDPVLGGRIVTGIVVPDAVIRGSFAVKYHRHPNQALDPGDFDDVFAFGIAVDYVRTLNRRFAIAGGVGAGVDQIKSSYGDFAITEKRFAVRASPLIVRFPRPQLELGVHVELVVPATLVVAVVGLDWFFW